MIESFFSKNKALVIVLVIILFLAGYGVSAYNRFIVLDQQINGKWSEVENQYQRQADLIPNLISVVSSAVGVETKLLQRVTEARSKWQDAKGLFEKDAAGLEMNNGVAALITAVATAENYPRLEANKQYVALTDELSGTQNRITVARGRYIESIQMFNTAVSKFPSNFFAKVFGFSGKEYYKAELSSLTTPKVGEGKLPQ